MAIVANDMRALIRSLFVLPPRYDAGSEWTRLVKRTVARFARGNIAAQEARILLPEEQEKERERALAISRRWKQRYHHGKPGN